MRFGILTFGSIMAMLGSCATVPEDAPVEFHNAKTALEQMDQQDADEEMPKTAKRAHKEFDTALDMWDDYRDEKGNVTRMQAVSKATRAAEMAENATAMSKRIRDWDKKPGNLQQALAALNRAERGSKAVAEVREPTSPFARLKGAEIYSTVAFFDTGEAKNPEVNDSEMKSMAEILKKSDSYKVTLVGYADYRGDEKYNEKLAEDRARTIAEQLYSQGISKEQVEVQGAGEAEERPGKNLAQLQLDRKVQAKVVLQ